MIVFHVPFHWNLGHRHSVSDILLSNRSCIVTLDDMAFQLGPQATGNRNPLVHIQHQQRLKESDFEYVGWPIRGKF